MACRVLVVDDSKFMRMMLGEMLESAGCEVIEADNGFDAVTLYEEQHPDLVTLDILMPDLDGIETLQRLNAVHEHVKVIMVTALGMEDYLERAMANGAQGCIIKPFSQEQVTEVVEHVLGRGIGFSGQ